MKKIFLFLLSSFLLSQISVGQATPFVLGISQELDSKQLSEKRTLNIYLPQGYSPDSAKTYPVIYLLDGSAHEDFIHICGLVQFFDMMDMMPPAIVVGISNVDRKRDFTFPTTIEEDKKAFPTTGGSEKFIAFLEKEVQPFVEKNYKTNQSKILIGQSLGGLLATEILLKKPQLFNQYIIVSPSMWWDNESLLKKASELTALLKNTDIKIRVVVGEEGKIMKADAKKLFKILKTNSKPGNVSFEFLSKEDHATILHQAVYNAFKLLD